MPTVPRISEDRVSSRNIPSVRVSTNAPIEAFGGGAQGVQKATNQLLQTSIDIHQEAKKKADNAVMRGVGAELSSFQLEFENEVQKRKGENAFTLPQEFEDSYGQKVEDISSRLNNEDQRNRFQELALQTRVSLQRKVQSHVAQEQFTYDKNNTESKVSNQQQIAINNFDKPEEIASSINEQEKTLNQFAIDNGLDEDTRKAMVFDAKSKTHIGVIQNLITVDSNLAKEYFSANKKDIDQSTMNQVKLDAQITAYHKANTEKIENNIWENIETLTPSDILSLSRPIENGGIGAKKARVFVNEIERVQNARVNEIINLFDVRLQENIEYRNLVDKLISNDVDRYQMKQTLVQAYSDGRLTSNEKDKLDNVRKVLKNFDSPPNFFTQLFTKSAKQLMETFKKEDYPDADVAEALRKLVYFNQNVDKNEEDLDKFTDSLKKEIQIKKNPKNSIKTGLQQNKNGAWVVITEKSDGSLGWRYARPEEIKVK